MVAAVLLKEVHWLSFFLALCRGKRTYKNLIGHTDISAILSQSWVSTFMDFYTFLSLPSVFKTAMAFFEIIKNEGAAYQLEFTSIDFYYETKYFLCENIAQNRTGWFSIPF